MPPPTLPDELLEEIFLRLPADEPECLVRASLASRLWLGRLTAPRFHARYSEFHGAPPMLAFCKSGPYFVSQVDPLFVSTTKFRVCIPNPGNSGKAWDCRHGRVLLGPRNEWDELPSLGYRLACWERGSSWTTFSSQGTLAVSDPITGCQTELDAPPYHERYAAAVLCAVDSCDHRACHDGASRVVYVGLDIGAAEFVAYAYVSLPDTGEWSKPCSGLHLGPNASIQQVPPILIQHALYFMLVYEGDHHVGILKYDMSSKCLSSIDAPLSRQHISHMTILLGMEDGSLGFAHLDGSTLNLWSRQMGSDRVGSWTECRVIDLEELLPGPNQRLRPIGSVEGSDVVFVTSHLGIYEVNIKSLEWKKISTREHFLRTSPAGLLKC